MSDEGNDAYKKYISKQISEKGQFIFSITFMEVPGDGIITGSRINPDYFPGQEAAENIVNHIRGYFMKEMERLGAFKPTDTLIQ
jgi:hypothetical protein